MKKQLLITTVAFFTAFNLSVADAQIMFPKEANLNSTQKTIQITPKAQNASTVHLSALNTDIHFKENNAFETSEGIKGTLRCTQQQIQDIPNLTEEEQYERFFKCVEINEFSTNLPEESADIGIENISFKGGFAFPNFTKESVLTVKQNSAFKNNLAKMYGEIDDDLLELIMQNSVDISESQIYFQPNSKTITSKAFDLDGNLLSTGTIENADLEGFLASLTADMNEEALINAAIKAFVPMKMTKLETFSINQKKDIAFNGEFYPVALYLTDNSTLSFYNSNEQVVSSWSQKNGVLSVDLKYPLTGKNMISFNVATTSNALENVKNQLTAVQSMEQIAQMAMFVPFSLLGQDYILHDLKVYDINGNVVLKTNQLRFSPQKQTPYPTGTVTFTPAEGEEYDFTFDGTEQIKVFDKKENKTQTFQNAESFIGYLAGFSNQTLMQNTLMALKNEIEQLKPITTIEETYWGGLMGYEMAMERHDQHNFLVYVLRCAVVAQTQGTGTGPLPDDMDSCTELMMEDDSFGFKDSKVVRYDDGTVLIEVEKWADDEEVAKQVKEKLTSSDSLVVDGNNIWLGDKASIQQKRNQPTPNKVKENQPEVDLPEEISNQDIEQYLRDNPQIIANYLAEQQQATQKANEMKQ